MSNIWKHMAHPNMCIYDNEYEKRRSESKKKTMNCLNNVDVLRPFLIVYLIIVSSYIYQKLS